MNSIYLRSISDNLKYSHNDTLCDYCKRNQNLYSWGYLNFCNCQDANRYHLEYDIAASHHTIFTLLWMKNFLIKDIVLIIAKLLYQVRKRSEPPSKCFWCNITSTNVHFVGDFIFCSKTCRKDFFESQGYNDKEVKLIITYKSNAELTTIYKC